MGIHKDSSIVSRLSQSAPAAGCLGTEFLKRGGLANLELYTGKPSHSMRPFLRDAKVGGELAQLMSASGHACA